MGNWKMYPTLSDAIILASGIKKHLEELQGVQVVIAPPTPWLVPVKETLHRSGKHLHLSSQNAWSEDQGAFTGETSAYLLKDIVKFAIIGHSERRSINKEDNVLISKKIKACLRWQIRPIVCVGELKKAQNSDGTLDQYEWSRLSNQVMDALEGVNKDLLEQIIIAYEPVWAIGTSNAATGEYAYKIIERLRERIAKKYTGMVASSINFLYGGSVNAQNSSEFLRYPQINGLLVGNASVNIKEFIEICRQASLLRV